MPGHILNEIFNMRIIRIVFMGVRWSLIEEKIKLVFTIFELEFDVFLSSDNVSTQSYAFLGIETVVIGMRGLIVKFTQPLEIGFDAHADIPDFPYSSLQLPLSVHRSVMRNPVKPFPLLPMRRQDAYKRKE